jgi:hypothetical protein
MNQFFFTSFSWWWEDPDPNPDPYRLLDPDPGGPKNIQIRIRNTASGDVGPEWFYFGSGSYF